MEYIDGQPTVFIFSEKAFCEAFTESLEEQHIKTEMTLCKPETRLQLFGDFYRSGIANIMIDKDQQSLCISLFDVIDKPDFSSLPENDRPVVNPSLVAAADLFFQTFKAGTASKNSRNDMLRALYQGKYLLPVIAEHDTPLDGLEKSTLKAVQTGSGITVTVPALEPQEGQTLIPFFTDWTELSRFDKDKQCAGNIVTFSEIEYFCGQGEKIAVNPFGFNMVIDQNSLALIKKVSSDLTLPDTDQQADEEEYYEPEPITEDGTMIPQTVQEPEPITEEEMISEEVSEPEQAEEEAPITLFELRSVPHEMIQILLHAMENTDGVNAAYLKGMIQEENTSYLVIVDFEGDMNEFGGMVQNILQQMQEVPIGFVLTDSELGSQAAQSTYPFYQKS